MLVALTIVPSGEKWMAGSLFPARVPWPLTTRAVWLFATLAIDTIDRRRDVRRLERLGATPNQVRGAAALYAGALFVVVTWVTVLLVTVWVRFGTHTFTSRHPETPIPFVVPWPIVVFLSAGLPLLAAGLAAVVARPLPARVDDRND